MNSPVAAGSEYPFGAPGTIAAVMTFRVLRGGKITLRFEADADPLVVTAKVSADGTSYTTTSATPNLEAISAVAIPARTHRDFTLLMRAGTDLYLQIHASGPGRGVVQVREPDMLQIAGGGASGPTAAGGTTGT